MKWYNKKIEQNDRYIKWARKISKKRNIQLRVYFNRKSPHNESGSYCYFNNTMRIYVDKCWTVKDFLRTFYHEIMHKYCYDYNIYPNYHVKKENLNRDEVRSLLRSALSAERYVELGAMNICKKHFPSMPWELRYFNDVDRQFLYNYHQPERDFLKNK